MTDSPAEQALQDFLARRHKEPDLTLVAFIVDLPQETRAGAQHLIQQHLDSAGPYPGLHEDRILGEYRLIRQIGSGGMGYVWEAEHRNLGNRVALKFLKPTLVFSPSGVHKFHQEAKAGARLQNPGLVKTFAAGESEGIYWIAQELVEDGKGFDTILAEMREKEELPKGYYRDAAKLFATIADSLAHAHQEGIIHRDIKPSNILVDRDGFPKVADFGLALVQDELSLSRTGDFAGTPFYVSPEQAMAKRVNLDARTDIFSLGATLYEALTLTRAFNGDTSQQVFHQILVEEPCDPQQIRSRVPRELAVICGKCLEKNPERRYSTMEDLGADLRRFLDDHPILAKPPSTWMRAVKWCRRHPVVAVSGSVAGIALVALTAMWWREGQLRKRAEAAESQLNTAVIIADRERDHARDLQRLAEHRAYSANFTAADLSFQHGNSAEARRLLDACPQALRGWEWAHLDLALDPSLTTFIGHEDGVTAVAWSPDGKRFVSSSWDQTLRLWDAATNTLLQTLSGHQSSVYSVAWSPDGTSIVSGDQTGTILLWNGSTGALTRTLNGHERWISDLAWSPDSTRFVSGSDDGTFRTWDASTGVVLNTNSIHMGGVSALAWSPDGRRIASGSWGLEMAIWDVETQAALVFRSDLRENVISLCWSPDGSELYCGTDDPTIRIRNAETGVESRVLTGHQGDVNTVALSPDGMHLASASNDQTIILWDVYSGVALSTFSGHQGDVYGVAWHPDGTHLVSSSQDRTLRLWDPLTSPRPSLHTLAEFEHARVTDVAWSPDGNTFVAAFQNDTLCLWDAKTGTALWTIQGHFKELKSVAWSPDGSRLATGVSSILRILDASTGEELRQLRGHDGWVNAVDWSPAGSEIVSASNDKTVRIWDATSGNTLQILSELEYGVNTVAWSSDGSALAGGSYGEVFVWDAKTGDRLHTLSLEDRTLIKSLAWSPDGGRIVLGSNDHRVRIWDYSAPTPVLDLQGHEEEVTSVAWSPDGRRIASSSWDGTIRIWDAVTGAARHTLHGPEGMSAVAWNPHSARLVSGSADGSVQCWESDPVDARAMWHAAEDRRQVAPRVRQLFREHVLLDPVLDAIRENRNWPIQEKTVALGLARSIGNPTPDSLNSKAWDLVDPDRSNLDSDVAFGLRLARVAIDHDPSKPQYQDTIAWAFFANQLFDQALAASEQALALSDSDDQEYQGYLERMKRMVEAARKDGGD